MREINWFNMTNYSIFVNKYFHLTVKLSRKSPQQMKLKYYKYVLLLISLVITSHSHAKTAYFRALTIDNGLSNLMVTSIYKDSIGFIWIGTDNSLDRFDGLNLVHYAFPQGNINKKRIKTICETTSGNLFVGNGIGLWNLKKGDKQLHQILTDKIDCSVTILKWNAKQQRLYIGTDKGLFILNNNNNAEFVPLDNNVISTINQITGIEFDSANRIWLTTKKGLCLYDLAKKKIQLFENKQMNSEQSFFAKLTRIGNTLYLGTSKTGIITFDILSSTFSKSIDVGSDIITDISGDGKDLIYVATDGNGVHFISHSKHQIVQSYRYQPSQKAGIRSNSVYSLLVDRNNVVWVGFYQAGLDYSLYQKPIFDIYSFPPLFDSEGLPVRTFIIQNNCKLIGTREGLYYIDEKRNIVRTYNKEELRSNLVLSLIYHKGEYYIGTYGGGVSILNPQTLKIRPLNNDFTLLKGHGFHFEQDKYGQLWIATSGGLYKYIKERKELVSYTNANSQLYSGNIYYVFFDSTNKGWIATENGLCIFDPVSKTIKSNIFPSNFFNREIIKFIYEDSKQQLMFCPDKGNIWVSDINMRRFGSYAATNRFKDRQFQFILEDDKHNYWLGSNYGLIVMQEHKDTYHSFGFSEGIPDPVFNATAAFEDNSGTLWFGNAKGLICFESDRLASFKKQNHKTLITSLLVNGIQYEEFDRYIRTKNEGPSLRYNENNLQFQFSGLQFTQPGSVSYEYKLEGYDTDWQVIATGQNDVSYSDLPAGKYKFIVRAEGNDKSEATLDITIRSFFSYEFWAIFALIAGIIYLFAERFIRLYKVVKKNVYSNNKRGSKLLNEETKTEEKYRNIKITETDCKQISLNLTAYFTNNKPFTNPDLKLADVAKSLQVSTHTLSFVFNQHLNKNYYDFVNEYRIGEFKNQVKTTDISKYTLTALAEQCGFSSRASFFRSFKKLTGITPNEYIRSQGKKYRIVEGEE